MAAMSLKLPENLLRDSSDLARELHLTRAEYVRQAIEKMNRETRARLRSKRMTEASQRVREESMRVNAEFAAIEGDPYA